MVGCIYMEMSMDDRGNCVRGFPCNHRGCDLNYCSFLPDAFLHVAHKVVAAGCSLP